MCTISVAVALLLPVADVVEATAMHSGGEGIERKQKQ